MDEEFDFGPAQEAKEKSKGHNRKEEPRIAEVGGDRAKKGIKAKTKTWSNVVRGVKTKG